MPLIAKDSISGKRIDITRYQSPRKEIYTEYEKDKIVCPLCGIQMIVRQPMKAIPHFYHKSKCTSDYTYHPESPEHLLGKQIVANQVKEYYSEYLNASVFYELPVPEVRRIIDVAFVFPSGYILAHEIQLSSISPELLEERTNDYLKAGIDVFWWLGKAADTETNREWCIERFGEVLLIDYNGLRSLS